MYQYKWWSPCCTTTSYHPSQWGGRPPQCQWLDDNGLILLKSSNFLITFSVILGSQLVFCRGVRHDLAILHCCQLVWGIWATFLCSRRALHFSPWFAFCWLCCLLPAVGGLLLDFYVCLMFIGSFFKSAPKSQSVSSPSGIATAPWAHCVPMIGVLQPSSSSLPLLLLFFSNTLTVPSNSGSRCWMCSWMTDLRWWWHKVPSLWRMLGGVCGGTAGCVVVPMVTTLWSGTIIKSLLCMTEEEEEEIILFEEDISPVLLFLALFLSLKVATSSLKSLSFLFLIITLSLLVKNRA